MATIAELLVKIGADGSGLRRELAATERQMKRAFGSEAMNLSGNLATGMGLVAAALGGVGVAAVKMAADMEQNRIAFTTMLGSAQDAEKMLTDLATFAEKTPFEFAGLVDSTKKLMAYGFAAQEVIPMLNSIGDAVAAVGGSAEVLNRVTVAFGQMKAKGFISGEEMRQLAEAGIPAWQMLAKAIGTDIPTAMKKAEDKAIDAEAAMAGMIAQMEQKYGGMMEKQSQTITGIISNIKDKSGAIMRTMGDEIVDALDLKNKLKSALAFLDEFAAKVKSSGIKDALLEMVPPGLASAIYAVAGALTAAMVPALYATALAAAKAVIAMAPLLAAGAAIGLLVGAMYQLSDASSTASTNLAASAVYMSDIQVAADGAAASVFNLARAQLSLGQGVGSPEEYFAGTGKFSKPAGPSLGGAMPSGGGGGGKDPVKEAERISDAIEREWVQTTQTQLDQLDIWKKNQLKALEETAAANENYERDKAYVAATYSVRRLKILQDESAKKREIETSIRDLGQGLQFNTNGITGNKAELLKIEQAYQDSVDSIGDKWDKLSERFATSTAAEKEIFIKNLNDRGIAYQTLANGEISFEANKLEEIKRLNEQYTQENLERYAAAKDVQADIDAAYQANSMAMLQAALTEENAIRMNDYAAQQSMMQTWQQAMLQAHATTAQLTASLYQSGLDGLSSSLSDIFTMTKSVGEAFADLGKALLKTIADFYAKQIAGQMMVAIFGKTNLTTMTAAGVVAGKAMAAAWAPAAAAVSLATFGANSAPAMLGIGATYALTSGLSFMANGGITTGPSLAVIGEGRHQEAVLPLSDRVFAKLAAGINAQGGGGGATVTQNVYGDINTEADYQRIFRDLGGEIGIAMMGA